MKAQTNDDNQRIGSDYSSGITSYEENNFVTKELYHATNIKNPVKRISQLKKIRNNYSTALTKSHINYYINDAKIKFKHCFSLLLFIIFFIVSILFALDRFHTFYQRFYNLDVSENTFQSAVNYYNSGDLEASLSRLELLYNNGWKDAKIVHYLFNIYSAQKKYDNAAEILQNYLKGRFGYANISSENSFLLLMREIFYNENLSSRVYNNLQHDLKLIDGYLQTYANIYEYIKTTNYEEAVYLCQNLQTAGANGFYFLSCYATALVNTNQIDTAYSLIMDAVEDDVTTNIRMLTPQQRKTLVNYIIPYLDDERISLCNDFLFNKLPTLNTLNDFEIVEPHIPYMQVEECFTSNLGVVNFNYLSPLDYIEIEQDTTLLNGKECYYINLNHYNGEHVEQQFFFLDMNNHIYIFKDGKYLDLPYDINEPSTNLEYSYKTLYTKVNAPETQLFINYETNGNFNFILQNTQTNEIIEGSPLEYDYSKQYAYAKIDGIDFNFFISSTDIILLIKNDPDHQYIHLEGRYILSL